MKVNDVEFNDDGNIIDILSGKILVDTPEERVRQRFINILNSDYGYPKSEMLREVPIQQGSKFLTNTDDGSGIRADIVVYNSEEATLNKNYCAYHYLEALSKRYWICCLHQYRRKACSL